MRRNQPKEWQKGFSRALARAKYIIQKAVKNMPHIFSIFSLYFLSLSLIPLSRSRLTPSTALGARVGVRIVRLWHASLEYCSFLCVSIRSYGENSIS